MSSLLRFAAFEINLTTGELRKSGRRIRLQPQPFRVLALLLERPCELVTRSELQQKLWGGNTDVDFEHGINFAVKKIREALGDDAERPRYIETLPRRGYRFIGKVEPLGAAPAQSAVPLESKDDPAAARDSEPSPRAALNWRRITAAAGPVILLVIALLLTAVLHSPPKVIRVLQLTHSGRVEPEGIVRSDGARLYLTERTGGIWKPAQAPAVGGEITPLASSFSNAVFSDLDDTGSRLLLTQPRVSGDLSALWIIPSTGGSAQRVGDILATEAVWSPDGRIAYCFDGAIYSVDSGGSEPRKLLDVRGIPSHPHVSPNGRWISFTLVDPKILTESLWRANMDGTHLERLFSRWRAPPKVRAEGECCGVWSPDGRYFVFRSQRGRVSSLWAVREAVGWLAGPGSPWQLFMTPDSVSQPSVSDDGRKILFIDHRERRELIRYDSDRGQFVPYLGGIPGRFLSFSRDGQSVAYRDDTDGSLWRSRADGSQRLRLTIPPMAAYHPSWSPTGDHIAFEGHSPNEPSHVYVVPSSGGSVELAVSGETLAGEPTWLPDGSAVVFRDKTPNGPLQSLNLRTREIRNLPSSEGFQGAQASPDGRYIAAVDRASRELMLFDLPSERWRKLASGTAIYAVGIRWSFDSRYVYFQDFHRNEEQPILRVGISSGKVEQVASSRQILRTDILSYTMTGLTPEGSPVATLIHSNSDIFALEVRLP